MEAKSTLYVFVRVWQGCGDGVTLHATEGEAKAAYLDYTGIEWGTYDSEKHGDQDWDASWVEEVELNPDLAAAIAMERVPGLRICEYPDCDQLFFPKVLGQDEYFCPKHEGRAEQEEIAA